jgi:hypothetical protein
MKNRRYGPLIYAAVALVVVWGIALAIFHFSAKTKMTVEQLQQYLAATDLTQLSPADRSKAIKKFADMVNSLSMEERMKWRRQDDWKKWFDAMTEAERSQFIEATLPTGFKQMLDAFSQLPDDQRKKIIDDAVNKLKQGVQNNNGGDDGKDGSPPLSPELEQKVRAIGMQALFTQSSAETKAELAPLVEQMEIQIRNGNIH